MRFTKSTVLLFLLLFTAGAGLLSGKDKLPVTRSVCLLKSPKGSGSGFFSSSEGMDVVFTNNHVVLGMEDVRIFDINGGEYEYDKVYCSPERDLAVIPVKRTNHDTMPNLQIFGDPDMLQLGVAVAAYGDSLGDGVIVEVKGVFQGIGPQVIEVSAPFVPGNSGGPVIESKTGAVIGIATYSRIIRRSRDSLVGSRFFADGYKPAAVRRFATRIDGIRLEDFESVTKEQIREDQEKHKPFAEAYDYIMDVLRSSSSASVKIRLIREYFMTHTQFNIGGEWHTSYLKNDAMEKWAFIKNVRECLQTESSFSPKKVDEIAEEENFRHVWQKYCGSFEIRKKMSATMKCPACDGSGKIKEKLSEQEIRMNAKKMRPTYRMIKCLLCDGRKSFTFGGNREYWIANSEFYNAIAETIKPLSKKIMGFTPGEKIDDLNAVFDGFYRAKKKRKVSKTGIFVVYSFKGNHKDKEAVETRLWFLGSVLMRIDLFYPVRNDSFTKEIYKELIREYGNEMPFYISEIRKIYTLPDLQRFISKQGRIVPGDSDRASLNSFQKQQAKNKLLIEHVSAAYDTDPFCTYCFPRKQKLREINRIQDGYRYQDGYGRQYYVSSHESDTDEPRLICISFLHPFYRLCTDRSSQKPQSNRFGSD